MQLSYPGDRLPFPAINTIRICSLSHPLSWFLDHLWFYSRNWYEVVDISFFANDTILPMVRPSLNCTSITWIAVCTNPSFFPELASRSGQILVCGPVPDIAKMSSSHFPSLQRAIAGLNWYMAVYSIQQVPAPFQCSQVGRFSLVIKTIAHPDALFPRRLVCTTWHG